MSLSTTDLKKKWWDSPTGQLATKFISEHTGCQFVEYGSNSPIKYIPNIYLDEWCNYISTFIHDKIKTFNNTLPENFKHLIAIDMNFERDVVRYYNLIEQNDELSNPSPTRAIALETFYSRVLNVINSYDMKEVHRLCNEIDKSIYRIRLKITYYLSDDELKAIMILCHKSSLYPQSDSHTLKLFKKGMKNTLLALQAVNRFARDHYIRVEDAETVLKEYINDL